MSELESQLQELSEMTEHPLPDMGAALEAALGDMEPVKTRRPRREFLLFTLISVPFFVVMLVVAGFRSDLEALSSTWVAGLAFLWFATFAASAYLGLVPRPGQVVPRRHQARRFVITASIGLVALGLFATQTVDGSGTYDPTAANVVSHGHFCSIVGLSAGAVPGLLALLFMRRSMAVGRMSMGLALGAAGGALSGLMLLFHCGIAERFHVGLAHGGIVIISALIVAIASRTLLK